jgi:hypothetical protein
MKIRAFVKTIMGIKKITSKAHYAINFLYLVEKNVSIKRRFFSYCSFKDLMAVL